MIFTRKRRRPDRRRTAPAIAAFVGAAVAAGVVVPQEAAAAINFQPNGDISLLVTKDTHHLVTIEEHEPSRTATDTLITVATGTSPAVSGSLTQTNGWLGAVQGVSGDLWIGGRGVSFHDTLLKMAPGTSPAVASMDAPGAYVVAYTGPDYRVHLLRNGVDTVTGANVMAGTSPAIVRTGTNAWEIAFHGQEGALWLFGNDMAGHEPRGGLGLAPGTSPSITSAGTGAGTGSDQFSVAFNAYGSDALWVLHNLTNAAADNWNPSPYMFDTPYLVAPGTNPSISEPQGGGSPIFVTWNSAQAGNPMAVAQDFGTSLGTPGFGVGLAPGTSPWRGDSPNVLVAYEKANNDVFAGSNGTDDTGILGAPDSSPVTAELWTAL